MSSTSFMEVMLRADLYFDEEARIWVGYCPVLDVYSQGISQSEAFSAVIEAVELVVKFKEQQHPPRTRSAAGPSE